MVIRKMNRVFDKHGRYLFAIITLVIIIAFVGFFTPGFMSIFSKTAGPATAVGTFFGEKITYDDLNEQADCSVISRTLPLAGYLSPGTPGLKDRAMNNAFEDICTYKAALQRGVRVSDKQIADYISQQYAFKGKDGKFDLEKYKKYVKNDLEAHGYSEVNLDEAVRRDLLQRKLYEQISADVFVTAGEVKDYFFDRYEKFDVKIARITAKDMLPKVKLTDKDIEAYYNANVGRYKEAVTAFEKARAVLDNPPKDKYKEARVAFEIAKKKLEAEKNSICMMPPRFKIDVIRFNYIDFEKKVAASITEKEEKQYYDLHKKEFKLGDKYIPFKGKVQLQIRKKLIDAKAKELAFKEAQLFADEAYRMSMDNDKFNKDAFVQLAKKNKVAVYPTSWFYANAELIKELGREPMVIKAVAAMDPDIPISNAITGERAAFIAFLTDREEVREAQLSEIRDELVKNLKSEKALTLAREKGREVALKMSEAKDKNAAAKKLDGITFEKLDAFVPAQPPVLENAELIIDLARKTAQGEVAPATLTADGSMVLWVEKRTLPENKDFEKLEERLKAEYRSKKQQMAVLAFKQWMLNNCRNYMQEN
jgi:hypothetical protein